MLRLACLNFKFKARSDNLMCIFRLTRVKNVFKDARVSDGG